jgi:protocatechuate 3,4-dioxygenase beta subunit
MQRRKFLQVSLGSIGGLLAAAPLARAMAESCGLTPPQTEGPFYPTPAQQRSNAERDADLTYIKSRREAALGTVVYLTGQVVDQNCVPVAGALVEIWQACHSGRYNHPQDPNHAAALDPNFQYWGKALTAQDGSYRFKTIKPGAYPADSTWMRPPHIHFKVTKLGYMELTSQLYFKGEALNAQDKILARIPRSERASVVVDFVANQEGQLVGQFPIAIEKL